MIITISKFSLLPAIINSENVNNNVDNKVNFLIDKNLINQIMKIVNPNTE